MDKAEKIANALGGAKRNGNAWMCKCPCHEDRTASLSVDFNGDKPLFFCHAGCDFATIKKALIDRGIIAVKPAAAATAKPRDNKYTGAKFYIYKDIVGNTLCRKVKLPNKKMWFERYERGSWISGLDGMVVPLYNLQGVVAADVVYLCEGEKDAETLITRGFCGTTNSTGATSFAKHLPEQLKGKVVVIIPDNDDAGRKRVAIVSKALSGIVKELRVFIPDGVKEKGDITDWVEAGGDVNTILPRSVIVERKQPAKKATRADYFTLFESVLNNPRRCMFNEKLMSLESNNIWNPAINKLEYVKSEALLLNETIESKFSIDHIRPHFFAFENSKPLEFLVDVPTWDGQDRIGAMGKLVTLNEKAGIDKDTFVDLLKEWCALVFLRKDDPMIQNRILVLQGDQGVGKDTWTSMLLDGLGQYCIPLSVVKEDKDTYLNLHRGLVMKISEFDKTIKTEVSTLKDIITAPSTNLRAPYDIDSKLRYSRCSFISSANIKNLLRDSTGNRRFLIFEVEKIEYAYFGWSKDQILVWQMQCLAQMQELAATGYKAHELSNKIMKDYLEEKTPEGFGSDVLSYFISEYRSDAMVGQNDVKVMPSEARVREILQKVSKAFGLRFGAAKGIIQGEIGTFRKVGNKRFWEWTIPRIEGSELKADLNGFKPEHGYESDEFQFE